MKLDPIADLEAWCCDAELTAARHVVETGAPESETERVSMLEQFGDELRTIDEAYAHVRLLKEVWCATQHDTAATHRDGMVDIRREEYELTKARHVFQRALTVLRMTFERKRARARVVDAAVAHTAPVRDVVETHKALAAAVDEFNGLAS